MPMMAASTGRSLHSAAMRAELPETISTVSRNPASTVSTAMRLWRDENNALLRQKLSQESMRSTTPLLEAIIRQGCEERVFDTDYPREAAVIITGMALHLTDAFINAIEADGAVGADINGPHSRGVLNAYIQALERILGASAGSLALRG